MAWSRAADDELRQQAGSSPTRDAAESEGAPGQTGDADGVGDGSRLAMKHRGREAAGHREQSRQSLQQKSRRAWLPQQQRRSAQARQQKGRGGYYGDGGDGGGDAVAMWM